MTKKIGITADNYKVDKFKEELTKNNIPFTTSPLLKGVTLISISVDESRIEGVAMLCRKVEIYFNGRC